MTEVYTGKIRLSDVEYVGGGVDIDLVLPPGSPLEHKLLQEVRGLGRSGTPSLIQAQDHTSVFLRAERAELRLKLFDRLGRSVSKKKLYPGMPAKVKIHAYVDAWGHVAFRPTQVQLPEWP